MDEARKEAKRIFLEATEITSPEARAEFISKACSIDRGLRDRVEQLLDADKKAGQFLAATENLCPEDFEDSGTQPGTHVGPYQLLERIATGGMGVVFVAEQQLPVKRRVALKVIRPGMDSKQVIARFEAERQTLALMEHQNIAKVFDAGTTEQGRPYFVMELVNGIPLTEYCDKHQLTPRERLDLFVPVCHAIQHAHQKGIIHRDVKPSNILVALYDGVAVPKVIDFGIAKAISQPLSEETVFTNFGQIIGTLEYMSPEQTQRKQLDVDTRSDIYSLGVVLYQLLTGTTPFDSQRLRSAGFEEIMRIIREEEPQKPSTKLSSSEALPAIASSRATDPAKLGSLVRGELDWIVLKAMAKEPQRRYPTAVAFASDLQCYLNNEPVEACPPSRIYYLRKFAKRHRAALAATSVICVALASGIAGTSWQAIRATRALARAERAEALAQTQLENALRERERAESATKNAEQEAHHAAEAKSLAEKAADDAKRENASSQAVLEFLQQDLLGMADTGSLMQAGLAPDPDLRLRTVLDRAAKAVDTRFGDQPTVNASIRMTLGTIYHNLGLFQEAEQHKRMALDLLTANLGNDHLETLEAMDILANTILRLGRNSEALELYEQSKIAKVRLVGENHPAYLQTLAGLAGAYAQMGLVGKALSIEEEILKKRTELLGADHPETLSAQRNLGVSLCMAGKPDEGAKLLRESVENYIRIFGKEHPKTLSVSTNLAAALCMIGKIEESIQVAEEAYKVGASVLGETHPEVLRFRTQLAAAYTHTGNHAKAHELLQQVFKAQQETVGMDHPDTMSTLEFMASSHAEASLYHTNPGFACICDVAGRVLRVDFLRLPAKDVVA